ncbi:CBS domain-containing protein [Oribacterium sp. oral taxon 102]|uniref:CBS domain-containing protein n=1 Tax=Oribacterium sp. oral taxon 102 TaxID=671214 RepID=UPI0015C0B84C|nr:CBS domain-containing protein [Oribacterium sp. oral taxon 102]NWO22123.1 CBS domain-containing protein [Oribacterium sp. oral taxon 102]
MNILFFLTPKCDVAFVEENDTLRNALEKMEYHRYSAIPVLSRDGRFVGTLTEGDLLFEIKNQLQLDLREAERVRVKDIAMKNHYDPVDVSSSMEGLVKLALTQNFVPVVDDLEHFIGIVRRRELMNYLYQHQSFSEPEEPARILRQRTQISALYSDRRSTRRYAVAD